MSFLRVLECCGLYELQPNNVELVPNGLHGIPAALEKLEAGVSAVKFVARPQETR